MIARANGRVKKDGRLAVSADDRPRFLDNIARMAGRRVTIEVRPDGKRRSLPQNSYYWSVVVGLVADGIAEEWGESLTRDEVHDLLKQQCNWTERVSPVTGECIREAQNTRNMTTTQFEDYLERCRRFAAEFLNISIPLPNEQQEMDFQQQ